MSWFSKNYEKAALGGAVAVALGLGYLGWSKLSSVESDFSLALKGGGNNKTAVADAELIPKARQSMKIDRTWSQAIIDDRAVDLFTGIALFVRSSDTEKPIDLFKDEPVHPPIPNTWWLENRIDPGFADSPSRDPDADGYSNLDEHTAKTNPNDGNDHPELLAKLMFIKDESMSWVLRPGFGTEGKFPLSYQDAKGQNNKIPMGGVVAPGELFFEKGAAAGRFKLLGHEDRTELNRRLGIEKVQTYVRIEDQRPNKKGTVYEFPSPLSEERAREHYKFDRTAVFSLEALGQSGNEFKVEENTPFALPPGADKKNYLLKSVTPNSVVIEYGDAKSGRKTVEISKGALPTLKE